MEHGSDPESTDMLGHTPFVLARIVSAKNVLKILANTSFTNNSNNITT